MQVRDPEQHSAMKKWHPLQAKVFSLAAQKFLLRAIPSELEDREFESRVLLDSIEEKIPLPQRQVSGEEFQSLRIYANLGSWNCDL